MPQGAVLLDVGANVGMYSIYAGVVRGARVFAFEPEAQNYAVLCRNIMLNDLGSRAMAWCAALSDESKFDRIYLSNSNVGGSCHSFAEPLNAYLRPHTFRFAQGSFATTIDQLVAAGTVEVPAYIKIDVDGFEHKIIKGAAATLRNPAVRSLLIEINASARTHGNHRFPGVLGIPP
jgi:FkbM family methyltransferase